MSNRTKTLIWLIALVILIGGAYLAYKRLGGMVEQNISSDVSQNTNNNTNQSTNQSKDTQQIEDRLKAVDFNVVDVDGKTVKLSEFFGKPIVVNFWASWCPPCKAEMPHFQKTFSEYSEEITFMMVDLVDGQRETVETGKEYIDSQKFTFPVFFDTRQEAAFAYMIQSIPSTLFIDKDGYIVHAVKGQMNEETLRSYIEEIK